MTRNKALCDPNVTRERRPRDEAEHAFCGPEARRCPRHRHRRASIHPHRPSTAAACMQSIPSSYISPSAAAMSDLPALLLASLHPDPANRKQAEHSLNAISTQPGFLLLVLQLVLEEGQDRSVRLAGSVFFKNVARRSWDEVRAARLFRRR